VAQARRPDLGVAPLIGRDRPEGGRTAWILLDPGQPVVEHDRIALELQVGKAPRALAGVEGTDTAHRSILADAAR